MQKITMDKYIKLIKITVNFRSMLKIKETIPIITKIKNLWK